MNKIDLLREIGDVIENYGTFSLKDINENELTIGGNLKRDVRVNSLKYYGVDVKEYEAGTDQYLSRGYHCYDILSVDTLTQVFFIADAYRNFKERKVGK